MTIYLGSDHRGFALKEHLKHLLMQEHMVEDVGAFTLNPQDDYVDFAKAVGMRVSEDETARGIVCCGSGVGVDIAANKINGVRSGLAFSEAEIKAARADDNINVLALPADYVSLEEAEKLVSVFLHTAYKEEEKYNRRLTKLTSLEEEQP